MVFPNYAETYFTSHSSTELSDRHKILIVSKDA